MVLFLIPLLFGFALVGASAFTAAYSRWWGERAGEMTSSVLRNFLGIPLWFYGAIVAWLQPSPFLFNPSIGTKVIGWVFLIAGLVPFIWGHLVIGKPTHMPSVRDTLVRHSLYAYVRHPIYSGGMLMAVGLALLKPTSTFFLACIIGFVWLIIQARLEEIDLLQRMLAYRKYMEEVPCFVPRLRKREAGVSPVRAPSHRG